MSNANDSLRSEVRPHIWLKLEYEKRKAKNSQYSLRSFARTLEISSGRLSEYLSNKREITNAVGVQIAEKLGFDQELTTLFLKCIDSHLENKKELMRELIELERSPEFDFIPTDSSDRYQVVAEWHYFAILSLMELHDFQSSSEWIAKKLGLSENMIKESLDRLERLHVIDRSVEPWRLNSANLRTTEDVASEALLEFHIRNLELALDKLKSVPVENRDFSTITIAIDKAKLPFAKGMIRDFRRKLSRLLETGGTKNEVFQLSIQLFPLSGD